MISSKLFALAVSASTLVSASVVVKKDASLPVKRDDGTVVGAVDGVSYYWNTTGTVAQCPSLTVPDLDTSLVSFDNFFPAEYDASTGESDIFEIGAFYLTYPEGTYAFALTFSSVTPNSTATWVDTGADVANVWAAIKADIIDLWTGNSTFQFIFYDVTKITDGVANFAGSFQIQIQTPSFVKSCGTDCGGICDPNICTC